MSLIYAHIRINNAFRIRRRRFPPPRARAAQKLMGFLMVGDGEKACWLVACWSSGMMIHLLLSSLSGLTENGKERIFFF